MKDQIDQALDHYGVIYMSREARDKLKRVLEILEEMDVQKEKIKSVLKPKDVQ